MGIGLTGRTLGVIARDASGRSCCAWRASSISTAHRRRSIRERHRARLRRARKVDLPTLMHEADFVVVLLPLTEKNASSRRREGVRVMRTEAFPAKVTLVVGGINIDVSFEGEIRLQ